MAISPQYSQSSIDSISEEVVCSLGYCSLKQEQRLVISSFVSGNDVFAVLPMGFGKTQCFTCLPYIFDVLLGSESSIVVVISPLISIMKDQI